MQQTGPVPTRFQVIGERSSGTNLVHRLLLRNSSMQASDELGWKHGFAQAIAVPAELAVICVLRNAADWALSMHSKPWHTVPELQKLEFSEFIRAPWNTIIDRPRYFNGARNLVGLPLLQDRDPLTGVMFETIFHLRRAKLASQIGYVNRARNCAILRLEDVQTDPEKMISSLLSGLGQPRSEQPIRPITKRLGSRFKPSVPERPVTPRNLTKDDLAFLRAQVNPEQERELGYDYC